MARFRRIGVPLAISVVAVLLLVAARGDAVSLGPTPPDEQTPQMTESSAELASRPSFVVPVELAPWPATASS